MGKRNSYITHWSEVLEKAHLILGESNVNVCVSLEAHQPTLQLSVLPATPPPTSPCPHTNDVSASAALTSISAMYAAAQFTVSNFNIVVSTSKRTGRLEAGIVEM